MSAKLQCEICGGKLIGKPGGIFECDSCGVEYNTEWAKQKIQEIRGTVTVAGTVDVQGTVKVDSSANKEALLQRGMMALEEEKWNEAKGFFDQALNFDAEYAEAYVGLAMVEGKCKDREAYIRAYLDPYSDFFESINIQRAKKFGVSTLLQDFKSLDDERTEIIAPVRFRDKQMIEEIYKLRNHPARMMLQVHGNDGDGDIFGLRSDGSILVSYQNQYSKYRTSKYGNDSYIKMRKATTWTDIVAFSIGNDHILGLKRDGTVLAEGENSYGQCNVSAWKDIKRIKAYKDYSFGIKADGTIVAAGKNDKGQCNVQSWKDIVDVFVLSNHMSTFSEVTIGLRKNGTVIMCGDIRYPDRDRFEELKKWKDIALIVQHSFFEEDLFWGFRTDGSFVKWSTKGILEKQIIPGNILVEKIEEYGYGWWLGLWADGTVKFNNDHDPVVLKDVIELCGTGRYYLGLHSDGTVGCLGDNNEAGQWQNIIKVLYGGYHGGYKAYGLCKDGTIVTTDDDKRAELSKWKLFDNYENIEAERKTAMIHAAEKRIAEKEKTEIERKNAAERAAIAKKNRINSLTNEKDTLQTELSTLSGLFSGRRRKEIQIRLSEIESKLDELK